MRGNMSSLLLSRCLWFGWTSFCATSRGTRKSLNCIRFSEWRQRRRRRRRHIKQRSRNSMTAVASLNRLFVRSLARLTGQQMLIGWWRSHGNKDNPSKKDVYSVGLDHVGAKFYIEMQHSMWQEDGIKSCPISQKNWPKSSHTLFTL